MKTIRSVSIGHQISFRDIEISESLALYVWLEMKRKAQKYVRRLVKAVEKVRQKRAFNNMVPAHSSHQPSVLHLSL